MNYDEILSKIVSSSDFNRGFTLGMIDTVKTLDSVLDIDRDIVLTILNRDFGFEDLNLLRDSFLESLENENTEELPSTDED